MESDDRLDAHVEPEARPTNAAIAKAISPARTSSRSRRLRRRETTAAPRRNSAHNASMS